MKSLLKQISIFVLMMSLILSVTPLKTSANQNIAAGLYNLDVSPPTFLDLETFKTFSNEEKVKALAESWVVLSSTLVVKGEDVFTLNDEELLNSTITVDELESIYGIKLNSVYDLDTTPPWITSAKWNNSKGELILTFSENVNIEPSPEPFINFSIGWGGGSATFEPIENALSDVKTLTLKTNIFDFSLKGMKIESLGYNITVTDNAGNELEYPMVIHGEFGEAFQYVFVE